MLPVVRVSRYSDCPTNPTSQCLLWCKKESLNKKMRMEEWISKVVLQQKERQMDDKQGNRREPTI
jgi:hypothetical protein